MSINLEKNYSNIKRDGIGSRLTPFEKLPRIGNSCEYIPHPPKTHPKTVNPRLKFVEKEKKPIQIAVKLNDGRRLENQFDENDRIEKLIEFIKSQSIDFDDNFYLSTNDFPKRQFKHFHLTFSQLNIQSRTLLFIDRD